jgi:hypothetical protein
MWSRISRQELGPNAGWPGNPEEIFEIGLSEQPYEVSVELRRDPEGDPFVTGITVRRWQVKLQGVDDPDDPDELRVSPRDVRRLPLSRIVEAALVASSEPMAEGNWLGDEGRPQLPDDLKSVLVPRGRPQRGKATGFYREIADSYRGYVKAGKSPVKEIARRKRVSENTVHQWVYRARDLGFLEKSSRSKRRGDG